MSNGLKPSWQGRWGHHQFLNTLEKFDFSRLLVSWKLEVGCRQSSNVEAYGAIPAEAVAPTS